MCGMFLLEDSKSIVDMLVAQGKDRAAMEKELSWYFHSAPQSPLHDELKVRVEDFRRGRHDPSPGDLQGRRDDQVGLFYLHCWW